MTTVQVPITGESGGTWNLNVRDGQMVGSDTPVHEPIVTVVQEIGDWRKAMLMSTVSAWTMGETAS